MPGEVVTTANGAKIVGHLNVPGRLAATASQLYAKNLYAFVETLIDKGTKSLAVKWEDELVKATLLTRDGAVVHPGFKPQGAGDAASAAWSSRHPGRAQREPGIACRLPIGRRSRIGPADRPG